MSVIEQEIPEGYKQTDVGVIPERWNAVPAKEVVEFFGGYGFSSRLASNDGTKWLKIANVGINEIKWGAVSYLPEYLLQSFKEYSLAENDVVMALTRPLLGDQLKVAKIESKDLPALLNQRVAKLKPKSSNNLNYIYYSIQREDFIAAMNLAMAGTDPPNIGTNALGKIFVAIPADEKEQTAIANSLSDVDALLTELEKLIAKKQAIKTATMQQLLTGKTRLPQFAYKEVATYTEGALEGTSQGQPKHSSGTNVNVGACDDGSQSGGMDSRRKGTKPSELGEIPEDWDVISFGELFEQSISRKPLKAAMTTTFVGMQDVSESAHLIKQTPVNISKVKSGFTYFERDDVLVAKITPCFENGKGCHTKQLDTEHGFGSTEFHVLRAKLNADSDFIYFWTTREIFRQELESEMVGSAGHRRVPFSALQNYKIPCPDSIEEQTAIATILSDMDNEIQTLEQRLAKTRQIKQGMMQELLTGRTRLLFDSTNVVNKEIENAN